MSMEPSKISTIKKKRKRNSVDEQEKEELPAVGALDLDSDDQGSVASDDGEMDEFPELDLGDSEEKTTESEGSEEEGSEDENEENAQNAQKPGDYAVSSITGKLKRVFPEIEPEYDSDSSTEDAPNRVGNIPMHWYDDLPHVGYDINGKKVLRPAKGDELDKFLATVEDPTTWTSVFDQNAQADRTLSSSELDIIRRLYEGENPDVGYDPYEPTIEWFTGKGKEEIMPLSAAPEPKRRFIPSKWEKQKVMKIVRAIRQGRILPNKPKTIDNKPPLYLLWDTPGPNHPPPAPAPKPRLPTNSESYNPPEEYLPTPQEKKEWEELDKEDRERDYLPQKYSALRLVPAHPDFINNRFQRLLDLYLAPRIQRRRLNIDPDSLIPNLPSPQSLRPFPVYRSLHQRHHSSRTRCISVSPEDEWCISGDEDGIVSMWEVCTGHETARWKFDSKVSSVAWCPRKDISCFFVGLDEEIIIVVPPCVNTAVLSVTKSLFEADGHDVSVAGGAAVNWTPPNDILGASSIVGGAEIIQTVRLPRGTGRVAQITFHRKGDYFATVSVAGSGTGQSSVWIHQLSKRHSQAPFKNVKGTIQKVLFHPNKPHFFVATQRYVRMYDLAAQKLLKTFLPGIQWISSMDVHPTGDHLVVGGYDRKLCWFDLELSDKPYKVLRYHARAIRSVGFHPSFPLLASSSDDGSIQLFHARVYSDLMSDPLIVPLKILRGHAIEGGLGVLDIAWLHSRPWLVSAGADKDVAVWCP